MYFRHVCSVFVYGCGENLKCNGCFYEQKLPLIYGKLAQRNGCGTCGKLPITIMRGKP